MTKWMTLDQKFIWPSYIDKNDNKLLFDSYSEAWLNSVLLLLLLLLLSLLLLKFHWSC